MDAYSGPPRDRPETTFSGYANGLRTIVLFCAIFAFIFLSFGIKQFFNPGKMEAAQLYATLGIGCALVLVAAGCARALQKEWENVSPLYIEFRGKCLRNILVDKEIYFLADDIVDSILLEKSEREIVMGKLSLQRGKRLLGNKLFISKNTIEEVFAKRDDRSSILLMRQIRLLNT